ncbi:hypothetical protein Dimus_030411 [Dionaea muscipula]
MKKLNRASTVDDELRERAPLLSPVAEASIPVEAMVAESGTVVDLKLDLSPVTRVIEKQASSCPVSVPKVPDLMEKLGGVCSQGGVALAEDNRSGCLLTVEPPLLLNCMVSAPPSPLLAESTSLAVENVDSPVVVVDNPVVVVDRPEVDSPMVDSPAVVVDSHVVVDRPIAQVVDSHVEMADVVAVVGQGLPLVGVAPGVCGGHEESRQ